MRSRFQDHLLKVLAALLLSCLLDLFAAADSLAQSNSADPAISEDWQRDNTVLTIAPDGAWGAATERYSNIAISRAIDMCKRRSNSLGCGAYFSSTRSGWLVGFLCGDRNIIAAGSSLLDAERHGGEREATLRRLYAPDMPPCVRIVTVDPNGTIVRPKAVPGAVADDSKPSRELARRDGPSVHNPRPTPRPTDTLSRVSE
jgi:hypothetical protein